LQVRLASLIRPIAQPTWSVFEQLTNSSDNNNNNSATIASVNEDYPSKEVFLLGMSLSGLITTAALTDTASATLVCNTFNSAVVAATAGGTSLKQVTAAEVLSHVHPDLHDTVLNVAAAQPEGCQLEVPGWWTPSVRAAGAGT